MGYYEYDEEYYEPTELEAILVEYADKCKGILLSGIHSEIEQLRIDNKSLQEANTKLQEQFRNIDKLKQDVEYNKQKYIKEGIENYQREALSGIRCGDVVWTIKTEQTTEKCKHCNGTHKINVEVAGILSDVSCPHCNNGWVATNVEYTPVKRTVSQINTSMWNDNKTFRRYLYLNSNKGCSDSASDEFIYDNDYGELANAKEQNDWGQSLRRDFWLNEPACLAACQQKKEEWLTKNNMK